MVIGGLENPEMSLLRENLQCNNLVKHLALLALIGAVIQDECSTIECKNMDA